MRVCITGAGGLIGRSLIIRLLTRPDVEITAFDRIPAPSNMPVRWLQGDLQNMDDCNRLVEYQDVIFHLAHTNSPLTSDQDIVQDTLSNLIPTLKLLKAIEKAGRTPHIIYPSSGGTVYGTLESGSSFKENHLCLPINSYGIQKVAVEHYLRVASLHGMLTATVFRIANAYGWLLPPDRTQGFIGTAVTRVLSGQPIRLLGNPENVRDYVHIDDILDALLLPLLKHGKYDLYNIGTNQGTSVAGIIQIIEKIVGYPVDRVVEESELAQFLPNWCILDTQKIQSDYGWQSKISLEEGIQRMFTSGRQGGESLKLQ